MAGALAPLVCLALASPAAAATTVGSSSLSSSGSSNNLFCTTFPCVLVLDQVDGADVATPNGVITSWSVRRAVGTVALRVLRTRPGQFVAGQLHATNISESPNETGSGSDTVVQTFGTHQPVKDGDYIGITLVTGSSIGHFVGPGDQIFVIDGELNGDPVDNMTQDNFEPLVTANVEPDADGDGYGDETEDACPSSAATQGACPVFTPPPQVLPKASTAATKKVRLGSKSATFKSGKASIKLTNSNAVRVKGKLKLKLGKKVVGSKAYSLAAGAAGTFKVKLAKAARKLIGRRGKVKLALSLTAKGATGKTFKTTAKLTVKKAAKKKKRKVKKKQTGGGNALDGKYEKDPASKQSIRFTVSGGGRRITNLTGSVGSYCSVYVPFGGGIRSEFRSTFAAIESLPVAADGTFAGSQKLSDTTTEITGGKLAGGIATGTVKVKSPGCTGTGTFRSRRTG